MTDRNHMKQNQTGSGDTQGHLGQKKAREEKQSEEKLRHMGDDSPAGKSSKKEAPKLGDDEAAREKESEDKLKGI